MNFMDVFLGIVIGFWIAKGLEVYVDHITHKYRWKCPEPGCEFKVTTSIDGIIERVIAGHNHDSPKEEAP